MPRRVFNTSRTTANTAAPHSSHHNQLTPPHTPQARKCTLLTNTYSTGRAIAATTAHHGNCNNTKVDARCAWCPSAPQIHHTTQRLCNTTCRIPCADNRTNMPSQQTSITHHQHSNRLTALSHERRGPTSSAHCLVALHYLVLTPQTRHNQTGQPDNCARTTNPTQSINKCS